MEKPSNQTIKTNHQFKQSNLASQPRSRAAVVPEGGAPCGDLGPAFLAPCLHPTVRLQLPAGPKPSLRLFVHSIGMWYDMIGPSVKEAERRKMMRVGERRMRLWLSKYSIDIPEAKWTDEKVKVWQNTESRHKNPKQYTTIDAHHASPSQHNTRARQTRQHLVEHLLYGRSH